MYQVFSIALFVFITQLFLTLLVIASSRKSDTFLRAPLLDIFVGLFTWIPWIGTFYFYGLHGLAGCFIGQWVMLSSFCNVHTMLYGYKGPTLKQTLNQIVGPARNHIGLIISLLALPVLLAVRFGEIFIYPLLVWTLNFPKYKDGDWINVSRQKFSGLVGHDLIWCLYCDWMTGVYSFGGEMLRNVESFWCPIRFYDGKKCENCKIDFPDLKEWVPGDGSMKDVTKLLKEKYPEKSDKPRSWFGHPERKKN